MTAAPQDPRPTDDELLRAFAAGRGHAFDVLVQRYGSRVRSYLGRLVADQDLADDLTQDVFVKLMQRGPFAPGDPELILWLLRVARNEAIDALRRRRAQHRLVESIKRGLGRLAPRRRRAPESPGAPMENAEFHEALEAALAVLPEPQRSAFLLREQEGMSYADIALVLGCSSKTVSSRIHRARTALRCELAPRFGGEDHGV